MQSFFIRNIIIAWLILGSIPAVGGGGGGGGGAH